MNTPPSERTTTLLLTGRPGVGKTTVLRQVANALRGRPVRGFYTEEIRIAGERKGFRLVGFGGFNRIIAHIDFSKSVRVGKYGVDVAAIDVAVQACIGTAIEKNTLYLIDEIGKMECHSQRFREAVRVLLQGEGRIIATVAKHGDEYIETIKRGHEIWEITPSNRNRMAADVLAWLNTAGT